MLCHSVPYCGVKVAVKILVLAPGVCLVGATLQQLSEQGGSVAQTRCATHIAAPISVAGI